MRHQAYPVVPNWSPAPDPVAPGGRYWSSDQYPARTPADFIFEMKSFTGRMTKGRLNKVGESPARAAQLNPAPA